MSQRLKSIVSVWVVLLIVSPFTVPLQSCNLLSLFGTNDHRTPASRPAQAPPLNEAESQIDSFVTPLAVSALRASSFLALERQVASTGPSTPPLALPSSPQVQQFVLRV